MKNLQKKRELYNLQKVHVSILTQVLERFGAALDNSATGCGKTLIATQIAAEQKRPTLVVAPKSSLPMWRQEMKDRGCSLLDVINYEMLRTGKTLWGKWASKIWLWNLPKDTLIIWDEVQKCQGQNTQNARMLWSAKPYWNLCLSATAAKDPLDMKALGFILGLHNLKNFWSWAKMNGCKPGFFGGLEFTGGDEALDKLHRRIFPAHGSRLTREDMKEHFKDTQIIMTPLDFGEQMTQLYQEMEKELSELADRKKSDSSSAEALTIRLRARQKAELLKVPLMLEMTEDLIKEGQSIAIFVNFTDTLEALRIRLSSVYDVGMISGKYIKDRQKYIDDFQSDKIQIILCNVQAGGVSVNLHDTHGKYPRTAIVSPSDNEKDILQVLGRIDRAGGKSKTQQHILFAANTIEEEVHDNCQAKMKHIKIFNEGTEKNVDIQNEICDNGGTLKKESKMGPTGILVYSTGITGLTGPTNKSLSGEGNGSAGQTAKPVEGVALENKATGAIALPDSIPAAHATFPPSQLSNFEKCPGFRNRSGDESSDSEAAEKGTRIHKALEKDSIGDLKEPDEKTCAQVLKDYIDSIIQDNLPQLPNPDRREVRLTVDLGGGLKTFGTCDRLMIYGKRGLMFDYKTGYREVADAEENAQAWSYVLGAFQKYSDLDEIEFTFLVPNRDEVLSHTFKRTDIPNMRLRLNTIIRRAMAIDWSKPVDAAKLNPQPELCEYCLFQGICPALAAKVLTIGTKILPGLPVPTSVTVDKKKLDDIPKLLRLAPLMEAWAVQVRKDALKLNMEEGVDIPGYARIERSTPRAVTTVLGAYEAVKDVIDLNDFLAACGSISVPQLEQYFADQAKRHGKGKAREDCNKRLREADVLREGGKIFYLKEQKK